MAKSKDEQETLPAEVKNAGALSTSVVDFSEDAGSGSEAIQSKDTLIPFLNILQKLSPQLDKRKPSDYIEGAEEGYFFNTASKQTWDGEKGVYFVPIIFMRRYTEWTPRAKGGGLVADHGSDESVLKRCTRDAASNKDMTPEGNEMVTSLTYYGYHVDIETGQFWPSVLSMSGTQQKKARQWNTMITTIQLKKPDGQMFNPAMFYMCYKLTTVPESNDKGAWMGFKIVPHLPTTELLNGEAIYMQAREFKKRILEGTVKADMASEARNDGVTGEGAGTVAPGAKGEDIPF